MRAAEQHFDSVRKLVRERTGITLAGAQDYLIESRLSALAKRCAVPDLQLLLHRAFSGDRDLQEQVVASLANHETLFFRDRKPFDELRNAVLPALQAKPLGTGPLRIWSAGCSTGQEIYSVAMILDGMGLLARRVPPELYATDFSASAVQRAAAGAFSQFEVQRGLPSALLVKYFRQDGLNWIIDGRLRKAVRFERRNLHDSSAGLGPFDIVLCRNVLMYFDAEGRKRALAGLTAAIKPGGYLLTGLADLIAEEPPGFEPWPGVCAAWRKAESR